MTDRAMAHDFQLRSDYTAQVVIPRDMSRREAERLCEFIRSMALDAEPPRDTFFDVPTYVLGFCGRQPCYANSGGYCGKCHQPRDTL